MATAREWQAGADITTAPYACGISLVRSLSQRWRCGYSLSPYAIGSRYEYILSALPKRSRTSGGRTARSGFFSGWMD
eukprot:1159938-Prorocentrum_minimum.AAC.1